MPTAWQRLPSTPAALLQANDVETWLTAQASAVRAGIWGAQAAAAAAPADHSRQRRPHARSAEESYEDVVADAVACNSMPDPPGGSDAWHPAHEEAFRCWVNAVIDREAVAPDSPLADAIADMSDTGALRPLMSALGVVVSPASRCVAPAVACRRGRRCCSLPSSPLLQPSLPLPPPPPPAP